MLRLALRHAPYRVAAPVKHNPQNRPNKFEFDHIRQCISSFVKKQKNIVNQIFEESLPNYHGVLGNHPYTDVSALKVLYNFSCLNYSVGYYNMHSIREYVSIMDVDLCLNTAVKLVSALGEHLYEFPKSNKRLITESFKEDIKHKLNFYKRKKGLN